MSGHPEIRAGVAPAVAGAALLSAIALSALVHDASLDSLMREGGPVENATAILYVFAIGAVWSARNAAFPAADALAGTVLLLAGLSREVSLRTLLERQSGWDAALAFDPRVWLVALVVCPFGWLVVRHGASLARGLRQARTLPIALLTVLICVVASQWMDRLPSLAASAGRPLAPHGKLVALTIEELLELALPALVMVAALGGRRGRRT